MPTYENVKYLTLPQQVEKNRTDIQEIQEKWNIPDEVITALMIESVNKLINDESVKAVIETDIENILNAKEQEYAPRLTTVESDVQFASPFNLNLKERVPRPVITFIDDDGHKDVYTRLMPIFRDKGLGFGSAIITDYIDNSSSYMTLAQLQECHQNGLETLSHCVNVSTNLTDGYTDEQIDFQLRESQKWLKDNGFEHESLVYPQNGHNLNIRKRTKVFYKYAFGENGFNDEGYIDHSRIKRIALGSWTASNPEVNGNNEKNTLNYYKACVDYAITNNLWLVFMLHVGQQDISQDVILEDLLDYIATTNALVLKPSEAFKIKSNKIALGDLEEEFLFIGERKSYTNISSYKIKDGVTNGTPITEFQKNVVSHTDILAADNADFPTSSGVLETYRERTDWTSFQIFQAGNTNIVYKRYWNMANSNWDAWTILNPLKILPDDAVTIDASRQSYTDGIISKCKITITAGTPSNRVGVLTTDRSVKNNSYIYQTFEPSGKTDVYKRYWNISINDWSAWELVNIIKVLPQNTVDMSSPRQSFDIGTITKCLITITTNTPENKQGILTTDRLNTTNYFIYQTFEIMESQKTYRRYWDNSTNLWSEWLQIGCGSGTTSNRPTSPYNGYCYFDETLNKPVWFNGTTWVDSTGTVV